MISDSAYKFKEWLQRPYHDNMSAFGWFAFAGLLIIIGWLWSTILRKIEV